MPRLSRILDHGRLKGTGRLLIYPVDQGVERGPLQCFLENPQAFDPLYHVNLAIDIGASAYACPLGAMSVIAHDFYEKIPLILKLNNSNRLYPGEPDQAMTASVKDAVHLGCAGVGLTIYPGSDRSLRMYEQAREVIFEAKKYNLFTVIWSYARGQKLKMEDETALDVICYAAHIAAQLDADIIKVKLPSAHIFDSSLKSLHVPILKDRVQWVMKSALGRPVVFSGGEAKSYQDVIEDVKAIYEGGGHGSIIGRNLFQRPYEESLKIANEMMDIYLQSMK